MNNTFSPELLKLYPFLDREQNFSIAFGIVLYILIAVSIFFITFALIDFKFFKSFFKKYFKDILYGALAILAVFFVILGVGQYLYEQAIIKQYNRDKVLIDALSDDEFYIYTDDEKEIMKNIEIAPEVPKTPYLSSYDPPKIEVKPYFEKYNDEIKQLSDKVVDSKISGQELKKEKDKIANKIITEIKNTNAVFKYSVAETNSHFDKNNKLLYKDIKDKIISKHSDYVFGKENVTNNFFENMEAYEERDYEGILKVDIKEELDHELEQNVLGTENNSLEEEE